MKSLKVMDFLLCGKLMNRDQKGSVHKPEIFSRQENPKGKRKFKVTVVSFQRQNCEIPKGLSIWSRGNKIDALEKGYLSSFDVFFFNFCYFS